MSTQCQLSYHLSAVGVITDNFPKKKKKAFGGGTGVFIKKQQQRNPNPFHCFLLVSKISTTNICAINNGSVRHPLQRAVTYF